MIKRNFFPLLFLLLIFSGCAVSNKNYKPNKKYSRSQLQNDFSLLRNILEQKHPALYWYTPKDSMNFYFDSLNKSIADSMTELQFGWNILAPLTQKIHCGHTSFSMSKGWNRYIANKIIPSFPLYLKVWGKGDTMVVLGNLNPKDTVFKKGTIIKYIYSQLKKKNIFHWMVMQTMLIIYESAVIFHFTIAMFLACIKITG